MIDARLTWQVWRQILTSDRLVARIIDPGRSDEDATFSGEEQAIIADYAQTPLATLTNVDMFRQGVARNALGALSLVPLTRHILFMSDLEIDVVAEQFTESVAYFDYGPNFWQAAGAFVAYLAKQPVFASPACQDVIAIDLASVALARQLGSAEPEYWPANNMRDPESGAVSSEAAFSLSDAATLVETRHNLADWIEFPEGFDPDDVPAELSSHWLIYFPAADAARAFVQLSDRAARIAALLASPHTAAELASILDLSATQVRDVVDALGSAGLLVARPLSVQSQKQRAEIDLVGADA